MFQSSNKNNNTTKYFCTRVKYLKLSEVKTINCHGKVVECRTRDPEVHQFKPQYSGKNKICQRSNQNNTTTKSLCTRFKYLKLSEVKTINCHGEVAECRTRDAEVPSSNPSVGKKKIFHRTNQNNSITNSSASEINTWNCQSWKAEVTVVQW